MVNGCHLCEVTLWSMAVIITVMHLHTIIIIHILHRMYMYV